MKTLRRNLSAHHLLLIADAHEVVVHLQVRIQGGTTYWELPPAKLLREFAAEAAKANGKKLSKGVAREQNKGTPTSWSFIYRLAQEG